MPCRKCCSMAKSPEEDIRSDSDISVEREEILLPSNRNGRVLNYEQIKQRSPDENAVKTKTKEDYGRRKIREVTKYYISHCTLHGFHYVFDTKSILRKILWLSILAAAAGFFFQEVKTSFYQYYQYPFTTMSTVEYPRALPFPAVTVCDLHDVRKSLLSSNDSHMSDVINGSLKQLEETLLLCQLNYGYEYTRFTLEDLDVFYSSEGHTCFTFNSGKKKPVIFGDNVSPKFGLEFVLNVQPSLKNDVRESGFKFILHQQNDLPLTREGFRVSPGHVTYVDLRLTKEKNLPYPYITNCGGKKLKHFNNYSRSNCYLEMLTDYIIEKCNCISWFMPSVPNTSTCSVNTTLRCVWPSWERFEGRSTYMCPEDCMKTTYDAKLSSAIYMPHLLLPLKEKHAYLLKPKNIPNDTKGALEYIMENYAVVAVYFDELRLDIVEQKPSYGFFRLVGDVGGQLGLVLGASVITLLELIDLVIMWVYFWFKGKAKNRRADREK